MDYRQHDREVWEAIFRDAPEAWWTVPPSDLMRRCARFLRGHGVERVLDLGSGFGRWTNFVAEEVGTSVVGVDYALGGGRLGLKLASPSCRSHFVAAEITALPFPDQTFDGFIAILILDNVAEAEGGLAASELARVVRPDSPGFVVLNPWPMPEPADAGDNPTSACTGHGYADDEALDMLGSLWDVTQFERGEHDLRIYQLRA